jgi:hypothetical protein
MPLTKQTLPRSNNQTQTFIKNSAEMQRKMINHFMIANITTVPLFQLSTMRRALWRPCNLVCVEPRITSNYFKGDPKNLIWFSGIYEIVAYKHDITSAGATSAFTIVRSSPSTRKSESTAAERNRRKDVMFETHFGNDTFGIDEK